MSGGDGNSPGNTGLGHSGGTSSGNVSGSSGNGSSNTGGNSGGWHYNPGPGPASSVGPDGQVHINITGGMEKGKTPPVGNGNGGGNGSGPGNGGNQTDMDTPSPDIIAAITRGDIPDGYRIKDGKIVHTVTWTETTTDGAYGHGVRHIIRTAEKEVPELTEARNTGIRQRQEADARAKAKAESDAKAKTEADARAKADAEARAKAAADKAAAEARAKAEESRKAEEAARTLTEQKRAALFSKAGVMAPPIYSPAEARAATAALAGSQGMLTGRAPGMLQVTTQSGGVMTTSREMAGAVAGALWRGGVGIAAASGPETVAAGSGVLSLGVGAMVIGFLPRTLSVEGDMVSPNINPVTMFSTQASVMTAGKVSITPGMTSVNLPVRGFISTDGEGRQNVHFVKTGEGEISSAVPILNAVRDAVTGLDRITVPAVAGAPERTVLINPVPSGPTAPANTGNTDPVPVTPVHTGTDIRPVDSIVVTAYPEADTPFLQDFIYWQPDATGTGVEAIYVMLSDPYGGSNAKGKYSNRPYNTDKAGGPIQNLDWRTATIDQAGINKVKLHTGRFGNSPDNEVMIGRLEKILKGELQPSDIDKRYYTHEIRELERYRALGVPDGVEDMSVWNDAHTATLEDYKVNEKTDSLYTPEAREAYEQAELKKLSGGQ